MKLFKLLIFLASYFFVSVSLALPSSAPHVLGASAKNYALGKHGNGTVQYSALDSKAIREQQVFRFAFDKSDLKPTDVRVLRTHADYLKTHPKLSITIVGHTDAQGPEAYNKGLGQHRAVAVSKILLQEGIDSKRITIKSYGAEQLADHHSTEQAHARNRRAIIYYGPYVS